MKPRVNPADASKIACCFLPLCVTDVPTQRFSSAFVTVISAHSLSMHKMTNVLKEETPARRRIWIIRKILCPRYLFCALVSHVKLTSRLWHNSLTPWLSAFAPLASVSTSLTSFTVWIIVKQAQAQTRNRQLRMPAYLTLRYLYHMYECPWVNCVARVNFFCECTLTIAHSWGGGGDH